MPSVLYTITMSLVDNIRERTRLAQAQQQAEKEEVLRETERFLRKTERLADERFQYVVKLIEGAASQGRHSMIFPTQWAEDDVSLLDKAIFAEVASRLRLEGFGVAESTDHGSGRVTSRKSRLILHITW